MNPIAPENNKLGFIGVGYMGQPIARRLLESGFKLTAYDRDRSKAQELIRYGGTIAESVAELSSCNVVLSCLPTDEAVLNIYRGPGGALANAHLGPSGSGATMKLVVNSLLGIGMQAIAEAVALGEKAGLDRNRLLDVLSQTAVVAPAHVGKLQRAMIGDYSPQFPLRLMNKDFGLILNLAAAVGARMPAAVAAFEVNARQLDLGNEQDFSAVILQMEDQAHLSSSDKGRTRVRAASTKK
jgi:3-hydroxyisobutyrate dehydrogenase-like beta-hydroxyacid dehydrogenase